MQLKSEERINFYRRVALSGTLFFLLLSFGANIFLILTRPPDVAQTTPKPTPLEDRLLLEQGAFGLVERGFKVQTQETTGTSAVLPVGSYDLKDGILPELPTLQYLYRDQGIGLDDDHIRSLLKAMNLSLPWESIGLLPTQERWRSADGTLDFVLDVTKRSLTISVVGSFGPSPEGRADDQTTIAIAKLFVDKFAVDLSKFGIPRIIERVSNGSSRTYVVWAMPFDGVPLVDTLGNPVYGAQVQVGRLSRRALSATFTLLSPDALAKSAYPSASFDAMRMALEKGGLTPAPVATGKNPPVASYIAAQSMYILYPADREYPTYIVPGLYVAWKQSACSTCEEIQVATIIPSLDPTQFQWYAGIPIIPKSIDLSAGSGSGQ